MRQTLMRAGVSLGLVVGMLTACGVDDSAGTGSGMPANGGIDPAQTQAAASAAANAPGGELSTAPPCGSAAAAGAPSAAVTETPCVPTLPATATTAP